MQTKMKKFTVMILSASMMSSMFTHAESKGDTNDLYKISEGGQPADDVPLEVLRERAFQVLMEEMYPTTPKQLTTIKEKEREYNQVLYDNEEPNELTELIQVSTKPGAHPVTVKVAPFHTTTINLIDLTGQPWPLAAVMAGNKEDYTVEKVETHASHNVIQIQPKREFGTTNVVLSLVGLSTTISIKLKNDRYEYHPTPILQLDLEGPQAKPVVINTLGSVNEDSALKSIVLGIRPDESFIPLKSSDPNVEAWQRKEELFIRTKYYPSYPIPRGIHHGPSEYKAFLLSFLPILTLTDANGYEHSVTLERSEE